MIQRISFLFLAIVLHGSLLMLFFRISWIPLSGPTAVTLPVIWVTSFEREPVQSSPLNELAYAQAITERLLKRPPA